MVGAVRARPRQCGNVLGATENKILIGVKSRLQRPVGIAVNAIVPKRRRAGVAEKGLDPGKRVVIVRVTIREQRAGVVKGSAMIRIS